MKCWYYTRRDSFIYLYICLTIFLSICLSNYLTIYLSMYLYIYIYNGCILGIYCIYMKSWYCTRRDSFIYLCIYLLLLYIRGLLYIWFYIVYEVLVLYKKRFIYLSICLSNYLIIKVSIYLSI